jgi:hypothetical protein
MDNESLISWNIPNFVSFVFMMAIVWVIIGTAGHLLVRQPASRARGQPSGLSNTSSAPGGLIVA